ncbi:hypothetical protein LBP_cg2572 [Lactiplantibacillus plantarum subsp. plantarum P-8]|nr:Hypothetical protein zj316_3005 [Lactiplantibacillus plantarum ZJ316]AGL65318.2 hypothetical protein LBP_cg2572 [Lactiplantibacillus plantarum subsp. plantarum P-8]ASL81034.1 hypothetical protein GBLP1_g2550 [Lactiplantibacillus plantarum]
MFILEPFEQRLAFYSLIVSALAAQPVECLMWQFSGLVA